MNCGGRHGPLSYAGFCYLTAVLGAWVWYRIEYPTPEMTADLINEIMNNHSGTINILFPDEAVLLVSEWDCLNMTVYNPNENMQRMIGHLALSEGLYWRKAEN